MFHLALRNLTRRPLRAGLTAFGLAVAVAVLGCLSAFEQDYRRALSGELDRMGMQMMLVPLGCPFDAAARVLKGHTLENSMPDSAVEIARRDPAVAVAAPLLMAAVPRPAEGRTDLWVGLDHSALALKPWWKAKAGSGWFTGENQVILGAEAAAIEMRSPGDLFYSPETGARLKVVGVLERTGTSDDSLFFVPLKTCQRMFGQPHQLTAVAIRLHDPMMLREASDRLQKVPGAQTVTLTEMMGTFQNLVGAVETLLMSIAWVAITASTLGVFNTLLGNVMEQSRELSLMRALGASRAQVFNLVIIEALLLAGAGIVGGLIIAGVAGQLFGEALNAYVPLAPSHSLLQLSPGVVFRCFSLGLGVSVLGSLYPGWQASRMIPADAVRAL